MTTQIEKVDGIMKIHLVKEEVSLHVTIVRVATLMETEMITEEIIHKEDHTLQEVKVLIDQIVAPMIMIQVQNTPNVNKWSTNNSL